MTHEQQNHLIGGGNKKWTGKLELLYEPSLTLLITEGEDLVTQPCVSTQYRGKISKQIYDQLCILLGLL